MPSFAYLFERFPSFTQTFCYREVTEMIRRGAGPAIYSIRKPDDAPADCPEAVARAVINLPEDAELREGVKEDLRRKRLPEKVAEVFAGWQGKGDKRRLYEAAWLGQQLQRQKIRHVHAHFSGIAARTAYWLKVFYGITYSFTGHANDMFCEGDYPVTLEDLIREAALVVTETDYSRDWLRTPRPQAAARIHRVYNGIDPDTFPTASPVAGSTPRILSVGRYIEKKGFRFLIDAAARLRDRGVGFECLIVGSGPLDGALRKQVTACGLEQQVILTGSQPQERVRELLQETTVFALACAEEADGGMDNFPTVIVEAMSASIPVVSTRLAGVPEMVVDGETGLLVTSGDAEELAHALETLLTDPERARRCGEAGRKRVDERFALKVTVDGLCELLEKHAGVRFPWNVWYRRMGRWLGGR